MQFEFEKVFNMKLVELEILKISYFGNFSSCYMFLKVILKNSLKSRNLGCYSDLTNRRQAADGMGADEPLWPSAIFQARHGHLLLLRVASPCCSATAIKPSTADIVFFFFLCSLTVAVVLSAAGAHHRHRFTSGCVLSLCCSQQRCASSASLRV
jgi:hypothetical protein